MEAKDFKRNSFKTLNPKAYKEGFRVVLKKRRDLNLATSVLATRSAVGHLMRDLQPFIVPGVQLNDTLRGKAKEALGTVLQHASNTAKLLKVKVPSSNRKIKPKHSPTLLLLECERIASEMLDTVLASVQSGKVVPLNDEEKVQAQKRYEAAQAKAKAKTEATKTEAKAGTGPATTKIVADPVNMEMLATQVAALLATAYEFSWTPAVNAPVAEVMEAHIKRISPQYPAEFFAQPPKKAAPPGLVPPKKKKAAEAPAAAPAAVPEKKSA